MLTANNRSISSKLTVDPPDGDLNVAAETVHKFRCPTTLPVGSLFHWSVRSFCRGKGKLALGVCEPAAGPTRKDGASGGGSGIPGGGGGGTSGAVGGGGVVVGAGEKSPCGGKGGGSGGAEGGSVVKCVDWVSTKIMRPLTYNHMCKPLK